MAVGVGVYQSVGVDRGCFEVDRPLLEVEGIAGHLHNESRVQHSRQQDGQGYVLHCVHVEFHGGQGRYPLCGVEGEGGGVANSLVGDGQLGHLERGYRVVGHAVEGYGPGRYVEGVENVGDGQPELPPHRELFVEDDFDEVGAHDGGGLYLGRAPRDPYGGDEGGYGELEVAGDGEEKGGEGGGTSNPDGDVHEEGGDSDAGLVGDLGVDGNQVDLIVVPQLKEDLAHVPVLLDHDPSRTDCVHLEGLRQGPDRRKVFLQQNLHRVLRVFAEHCAESNYDGEGGGDVGVELVGHCGVDSQGVGHCSAGQVEVLADGGGGAEGVEEGAGLGGDGGGVEGDNHHQVGPQRQVVCQTDTHDEIGRRRLGVGRGQDGRSRLQGAHRTQQQSRYQDGDQL